MGIEAHSEQFTIQGPTHKLPYEPDKFSVKPIVMVPFAVIATGIAAFIITTLIFDNIFDPAEKEASTFPEAAKRGKAPLNDRLARMSSTDPKAEVNAPRLEWMRLTENVTNADKSVVMVDGEMTTALPKKTGNSPEYHPEDLRAERQPGLTGYSKSKDGLTKIPVDKAMDLIFGGLVGVQPNAKLLPILPDWDRPKESNGGQPTPKTEVKKEPEHK